MMAFQLRGRAFYYLTQELRMYGSLEGQESKFAASDAADLIKDPRLVTKDIETFEIITHDIFSIMDLANSPMPQYNFYQMVKGVIDFRTGEDVGHKTSYMRAFHQMRENI